MPFQKQQIPQITCPFMLIMVHDHEAPVIALLSGTKVDVSDLLLPSWERWNEAVRTLMNYSYLVLIKVTFIQSSPFRGWCC